ncbi:phage tail protein [Pelosinus sp. UFO1]|uniref:phage tail-collar fiber domain-containing protein n=1 Tax=Pelosinus sp. UFO1 TaxID=484770 RepID=UPI0004D0E196|nr:phage tail protein [Pelosinus sp. UFO1]AIF51267.1 hypothetical protein UFO1_1716 [Pelosinus sp. UFO1]
MPNWSGGILTTKGQALQAKVDAGQTKLIVTKMKVGSGVLPNGQNLQSLNDLVAPEMNVPISAVLANANISTIVGVITNAGLTNGFNVRELGVYAQDPILGEILYAITTDSAPDYLPPEGGAVTVSSEFSYNIVVSNAANVTATIDLNGLVTVSILQLHKNAPVLDHPDNSVTDAKIGNRTITDTTALAGAAGTLTTLLGRIGNMLKSITGKANWYTAPATTLEAAKGHMDAPAPHAGHAPNGYGLGGSATTVDDCNLAVLCGFYWVSASGANMPSGLTLASYLFVETLDSGNLKQTLFSRSNGAMYTRQKLSTVWQAWQKLATSDQITTYGLGSAALAIGDWNNYNATGFYFANNLTNAPVSGVNTWCWVQTINYSTNYIYQQAHTFGASPWGISYERTCNLGTWSAWKQIATMDLVAPAGFGLGTASTVFTGDYNSVTANGFYRSSTVGQANAPSSLYVYFVEVTGYNGVNYTIQTATNSSTGEVHTRAQIAGVWSSWKQIATMNLVAPAGYGLGAGATRLTPGTDLDTVAANGWYDINAGVNTPGSGIDSWFKVFVICGGDTNYVTQKAYTMTSAVNYEYTRQKTAGVWGAWKKTTTSDESAYIVASGRGTGYYWRKWSNGDVEQWAVANSYSNNTFPIAFPTEVTQIVVTGSVDYSFVDKTQFYLGDTNISDSGKPATRTYMAIGH